MVETEWSVLEGKRLTFEDFFVFDTIGEVGFVEVKAGFPLLTFTEAEILHELGGSVAEVNGDWFIHGFSSEVLGGVPGVGGGAGFLGESESYGGVGENETGFWHTDTLYGLEAGGGEAHGAVACEPNVFGGEDNHSSGNKLGIFAGFNHSG